MNFFGKKISTLKSGKLNNFDATTSSEKDGESFKYAFPEDSKPVQQTIILKITDNSSTVVQKEITIEVVDEEEEENFVIYLILVVIFNYWNIDNINAFKKLRNL